MLIRAFRTSWKWLLISALIVLTAIVAQPTLLQTVKAATTNTTPDSVAGCDGKLMPTFSCLIQTLVTNKNTGSGSLETFSVYNAGIMAGAIGYGFAGGGGSDPSKEYASTSDSGAITTVGNGLAYMYQKPPASLGDYVADLIQHNNLVRPAYAQGIGFQSLSNVLPIWKVFRDAAYLLFTIVFFFVGFFIIFRQQIDGHTVASISTMLPNLIISLILITFSYAIAGFMIDLMYLVIYFIIWLAGQVINQPLNLYTVTYGPQQFTLEQIALKNNIFSLGLGLAVGSGPSSAGLDGSVGGSAAAVAAIVQSLFSPTSVGNIIGKTVGATAQIIAYAVFAVALFFAVVRTFFALLKSYVTFLIMVIFSPIQLLMGALSGQATFLNWAKGLAATLAPFPLVIGIALLSMALTGYAKGDIGFKATPLGSAAVSGSGGFQAPLLQLGPATDATVALAIQGLIGFGLLMFMPEAVAMSNKFFGAKGGLDLKPVTEGIKSGWKGGKPIPGLDVELPGVRKIAGTGARVAGGALRGAGIGLAAGAVGGAMGGASFDRSKEGRVIGGSIGGTLGALAGGTIGAVTGAGSAILGKKDQKQPGFIQQVRNWDTASEPVREILRQREASQSNRRQDTIKGPPNSTQQVT